MVKDINELAEFLRKSLKDQIKVIGIDNNGVMEGIINNYLFALSFNSNTGLLFMTIGKMPHDLLSEIRRLLLKATGNFKTHVSYDKQVNDVCVSVIEWDFVDPDELMYRYDCMGHSLKNVKNIRCYDGGLQVSYGILRYRDRIFVPLPKEQQLTEATLVALERRIAKAVRKNEEMFSMSEYKAMHMKPCMSDDNKCEKEKTYTKKK